MIRLSLFAFPVSLLFATHAMAQESLLPRNDLRGLEKVALDTAKAGHAEPWRVLVTVLRQLGLPEKDVAALQTNGDKELGKRKKPPEPGDKLGKALASEVVRLGAALPRLDAKAGPRLATLLLQLDSSLEPAHAVLGHERGPAGFGPAGETGRSERRAALQRALQDVRRLPIVVTATETAGDSADGFGAGNGGKVVAEVAGRPLARAQVGRITILSTRPPVQLARIVTQALRGIAIVRFLFEGKLEVPRVEQEQRLVMLDHKVDYERAIALAASKQWLTAKEVEAAKSMAGFALDDHSYVDLSTMETEASAVLMVGLTQWWFSEAALSSGVLNWTCRAVLGTAIPNYVWIETKEPPASSRTESQDPKLREERIEMLRMANAGLAGGRAYLRFLARLREEPPWSAAMLRELGQVQGEALLKATFVAEYLVEEGRLGQVEAKVREDRSAMATERFAAAVAMPLAEFDARFREWLVGIEPGLVQRWSGSAEAAVPRSAVDTLASLEQVRQRAFGAASASVGTVEAVGYDAEGSRACLLHARYLVAHPEHAAKWPEAHEENAAHAEWTAAGAWAGAHSVIAPGVENGGEAIEAWMGTFFHRLPLLDPGLLRIGYGFAGDVAVLDSGSLVAPRQDAWHVVWPPAGASDVPTRFVAELPNPVPGEDQSTFGYPITLQAGMRADRSAPIVEMSLHEGGENGPTIACWFSSPQQPLNPDCAPMDAFCLIPKSPLRAGTKYTVVARMPTEPRELVWSWKTH